MYYTIRHTTRFRYSAPINESIMEVRIQPRSEGNLDIPNSHNQLTITAQALVDVTAPSPLPEALTPQAWDELDALTGSDDYWDTLMPSRFANPSELLYELAHELDVRRRDDPLTVLRDLNSAIYRTFEYSPKTTRVDSPIDEALSLRKGVCQDLAHIMITLARHLQIPCRYVSGYLYRGEGRSTGEATHAWVEAYLPDLGWVGFDPTNNTVTDERHVRVAIGRDYADVPPTRGVFRGKAESELAVTVRIAPSQISLTDELPLEPPTLMPSANEMDERDQVQQQIVPQQQ